jgi:transcription initiation factor TFIIB
MEQYYQLLEKYTETESTVDVQCKCNDLVDSKGVYICRDCGSEKEQILEDAEWRYYGADDSKNTDPTRCGMPVNSLLPESSIGTVIGYSKNNNRDVQRIRNYSVWTGMPYKERSLYNVFNTITTTCKKANLPMCIIQESKVLYKHISTQKISRGNNRKGIIAATVYHACKIKNVPRSTNEIAKIFDIKISIMTKGMKQFYDMYNTNNNKSITCKKPTQPIDYIERFISQLECPSNVCELSKTIAIKAKEEKLTNQNTPPSMAVGCIYLACQILNFPCNKKNMAKKCAISEVTINKCYKKLNENKDKLI